MITDSNSSSGFPSIDADLDRRGFSFSSLPWVETARSTVGLLQPTAFHEAGHVAARLACGMSIELATIDRDVAPAEAAGCVWGMADDYDCLPLEQFSDVELPGSLPIDGQPLHLATRVFLYANTIVALAGKEAERLLLPNRDRRHTGSSDLRKATFLASYFPDPEAFLDHARRDAATILVVRRRQVEAIASALIEQRTLDAADIDDVLSEFSPALRAERTRRRRWAAMAATAEQFRMMTGGLVRLDGVCAT